MSAARQLGGARAKHWRKHEVKIEDHVPVRVTWYVIECKCGWSSPLCGSWDDATTQYERHRRRPLHKKGGALRLRPDDHATQA